MDRLDLELYADRLALHADRLADDVAAARLRLAWGEVERRARRRLDADDVLRLEAAGVLPAAGADGEDGRLLERRRAQLDALRRLQAVVEEELVAVGGRPGRPRGR